MDDLALIERRKAELVQLQKRLHDDIARCQEHIAKNEAELIELEQVKSTLERLRSARRTRPEPRVPAASSDARVQSEKKPKVTVRHIIETVLSAEQRSMRPAEIDRMVREQFDRDFHEKQIGKECCRLYAAGHLLKDKYTSEYSLPPDWGSDQPSKEESLPHLSTQPAKGREAVPGGVS